MPRLTDDAIKQGLLHTDEDARSAAFRYYTDAYTRDASVMPLVIEAIRRYGWANAFRFLHPARKLPQSEPTIAWAIEELKTRPRWSDDQKYDIEALSELILNAEPTLVRPFREVLKSLPAFDPIHHARLDRRIRFLDMDVDGLWNALERVCEDGKREIDIQEVRWDEAEDLVEELGRRGDQSVDRVMELLAVTIEDYEDNPLKWMEPLVVRLAGELRYEPAVPMLVAKLREDDEVLNEECQRALIKIGTDRAIEAIRAAYGTEQFSFRLYASSVFSHAHSDLAVQACLEALAVETNYDLRNWLACALVNQLSTEGIEAARQVLRRGPIFRDLRDSLLAACVLTGQEFPELDRWRNDRERDRQRYQAAQLKSSSSSIPATPTLPSIPHQVHERVGRNDPCPCGSGKKFKKCCMAKGAAQ